MSKNIRDIAFEDYKVGMSYPDISKKHDVSLGTVKSWASRHWKGKMQPQPTATDNATATNPVKQKTSSTEVDKIIFDAVEENTELTAKQKDFCRYFIRNRNATQAYLKAYECTYAVANTEGPKLLVNPRIKEELRRLREIKNAALGDFCGDDVVELHMRIAFSDLTDFVEFENKDVPVLDSEGKPRLTFNPDTGEAAELYRNKNEVRLKPSAIIDGSLLTEVSEGREGVKIKLSDKQRSLAFLERWFELNPMDRHRKEYDNRRIALEEAEKQGYDVTPDMEQYAKYYQAKNYLWEYCKLTMPEFYTDNLPYLKEMCQALQDFETDDTELLVLNLPPRHGKTLTMKHAAKWYLGRNSQIKLIGASYNEKLSRQLSKGVRDDITEIKADINIPVFSDIFPDVRLKDGSAQVDMWRLDGSPQNNYLATAPKATVTGFGAEIIIIDDVIKSAYEANHKGILDDLWEWFSNTLYSRLEGRRKIILVMTRWATKDLAGRVINMYREQGRKIKVITKKAFDGTKMLNESILNKEQYENLIQTVGEDIVKANYDQEPIDLKGRLYGEFVVYQPNEIPKFEKIKAVCDTADTGADFMCQIIYGMAGQKAYLLDAYYTQEAMEITEPEAARRLIEFDVDEILTESNSGGRSYSRAVEREYYEQCKKADKIPKCKFKTFTQTKNKEARILSNSTNVTRRVRMPTLWKSMFPKFYTDVVEYQRIGKNAQDGAQDALTLIVEREIEKRKR